MAEDAVKVKGYKSRIQIADNPVTSVQQQKICFFSEFLKHPDHCIPIRIFKTASCLEIKKRNFSRTQRSCLKFRIHCIPTFQFLSDLNWLRNIFCQIPEVYKNAKRNNCQYPGEGISQIKVILSADCLYRKNTVRYEPQ